MFDALRAVEFAVKAHHGQHRKWTNEPYVMHPIRVAQTVRLAMNRPGTPEEDVEVAVMIALLHDVVEDCGVHLESLKMLFGERVMLGVGFLTKPPDSAGNRATRKEIVRATIEQAPNYVKTVKAADILDNLQDIVTYDENFGPRFVKETQLHMPALVGACDVLLENLFARIEDFYKERPDGKA